ncbi:hypothetical protein [Enterobacteria phage vB_EcoM_IME338]|uniref:Uncharacterized protein n=1 Tax=Enterobacteria phage vB_EcoM_IME338 TaxID=2163888 RepID=A0A2S1GPK5_9CAUD|nr:hypothetical protein [Enterobacteria phage vB_EcoM_IME338]
MKVILARDKKTRKIVRSAVFKGRHEVIPFAEEDVLTYKKVIKRECSNHFRDFFSEPLEDFKSRCGEGIIIQEAIIHG